MIYPYGSSLLPDVFENETGSLDAQDGSIEQFGLIDLKLSDKRLIESINERVELSKQYFDQTLGFNLRTKRLRNITMYLGLQVDETSFYESETPYIENQIRPAIESIVAYATARTPEPFTTKGGATPEAAKFADQLRKALKQHSEDFDLKGLLNILVRNWLINQASYMFLEFDPSYGDDGEIIPSIIPANELVVDKNAKYGQDPDFIAIFEESTVEDLLYLYPEKKKAIMDALNMQKLGKRNVTQEVITKKVYFSYYGDGKKRQGMCVYFNDVMLIKTKDLNWLEGRKNFLRAPRKPIIPLNVLSDGKHWVDFSNFVDDGVRLQRSLNSRGRQISLNADGANGTKVVNGKSSGLTKEDAKNWTPGPNRTVYLRRAKDGVPLKEMIDIIPAQDLPQFVVEDKQDIRGQIGQVMATPVDQTDVNADPATLGENLIKKNNLNARQDEVIRGLDRFLNQYYSFLAQMMFVWYDEDHFFAFEDINGEYEDIIIKRYYFDPGMRAGVKGQTTVAKDNNRDQAIAVKLDSQKSISKLDLFRILGYENYQEMYDNWAKEQTNPLELARDAIDTIDNADAYAELMEFVNGKRPDMVENPSKDFILTLRKLMVPLVQTGIFRGKKVKRGDITAFVDRFSEYLDGYLERESLDQLGQEGMDKLPQPGTPIPPPMPPQQFDQLMHPQPPMLGGPGGPMPPPGVPPGAMPPGMAPGMPPGGPPPPAPPPPGAGMFAGTGLPNPGRPNTPAGLGIPGL